MYIDLIDSPLALQQATSDTGEAIKIHHYKFKGYDPDLYLFKDFPTDMALQENFMKFAANWYFDDFGQDQTYFQNFSWGNLLTCGLLTTAPYLYREYLVLKKYKEKDLITYSSEHETFNFLLERVIKGKKTIRISQRRNYIDLLIRRQLPTAPKSISLFTLQSINFFKASKKLTVSEGTTAKLYRNNPDFLLLNSRQIKKSFFRSIQFRENVFEKFLPSWAFDPQYYYQILTSSNKRLKTGLDDDFLKIFSEYISFHFKTEKEIFKEWINFYYSIFKGRKFSEFHVPGERYEPYLIGAQIAKSLGTKITLIWDGFSIAERPAYMKDNKNWLFDEYLVFDQSSEKALLRQGLPQNLIKRIKDQHPILRSPPRPKQPAFDVVVFCWIPMEYNPYCFPDEMPELLKNLITCLLQMNLKVAIKLKSQHLANIYSEFIDPELAGQVTFLTGPGPEAMVQAKVVLTGVSTAIAEAEFINQKLVIYEPYKNGFNDLTIQKEIQDRYKICRHQDEAIAEIRKALHG